MWLVMLLPPIDLMLTPEMTTGQYEEKEFSKVRTGRARLIRTRLIPLNSKFLWKFGKNPIISCLKCMVNWNMVNLKFHQFEVNLTGI